MSKSPHLLAGILAGLFLVLAAIAGDRITMVVESNYVHSIAHWSLPQTNQGSAIQRAAVRENDILPIYGSSELNFDDPYHATRFFFYAPTGFIVLPVGMADTEPLIMLQKIAALGTDLRGKKVVISLSPSFFHEGEYHEETYAGNFSALHANALAFSPDLDLTLKQGMARRMLEYRSTLKHHPVLQFALERIADGSAPSLALYDAVWPLGRLESFVLGLQDDYEVLSFIGENREDLPEIPRNPRTINWAKLATKAEEEYKLRSTNNSFGMENGQYLYYKQQIESSHNTSSEDKFVALVQRSKGWIDLDLLLKGLDDLQVDALVILLPMNGGWFDWQGISLPARSIIYTKAREVVAGHSARLVVLDKYDGDKYFLIDPGAHMSSKGWVYYNQVLDAFYHGTLDRLPQ